MHQLTQSNARLLQNREGGDVLGTGKWRLFNTELRMLAPQQCYEAVIADGTYTILLIQESEIDIDTELLLSAMNIGIEANEQGRCSEIQEDLEEI